MNIQFVCEIELNPEFFLMLNYSYTSAWHCVYVCV